MRRRRDGYDAIYETSRYEKMIIFRRPTTAELLDAEERRLREEKELLERLRREQEERERKAREDEERRRLLDEESRSKLHFINKIRKTIHQKRRQQSKNYL